MESESGIVSTQPSFHSHWRDIKAWEYDGIQFSSPSDEAAKMFDAILHQAIYHYHDAQLGGFSGTSKKMMAADPDFAMGQIFSLGMDCFATSPLKNAEPRKKLIDFSNKSKERNLTKYERMHLAAAEGLAKEDYWGAMIQFQDILKFAPRDPFALQMAYFLALTIGETERLKSIPLSVVNEYNTSTPFYGHVYGKLCFGQGENGEFDAGELSGRRALDFNPLDNWSHHALAHNFEESGRPLQGRNFLFNCQRDWTRGTTFSHHIWWHSALFHVQLGEFQEALQLYDDRVGPMTLKDGGNFPLSDGSSLLMRLHLEGVDIGERAQEQARSWVNNNEDFVSLFYDGHAAFTSLLAGDTAANATLLNNMKEYINGQREGWNKDVTARVGVPLVEGINCYMNGDFSGAVDKLAPIMSELQDKIQGSRAQKDIFRQILLHAAARSKVPANLKLAEDILESSRKQSNLPNHTPLNQRFYERMLREH